MADKIARCPASANTSNATLPPSLCSRSIVDDVYTADVPLAFLTVIYAPLPHLFFAILFPFPSSSVSTTLVIPFRLGFDIARFPPTRVTLARSLSVAPSDLSAFVTRSTSTSPPIVLFAVYRMHLCLLSPTLRFSFSLSRLFFLCVFHVPRFFRRLSWSTLISTTRSQLPRRVSHYSPLLRAIVRPPLNFSPTLIPLLLLYFN